MVAVVTRCFPLSVGRVGRTSLVRLAVLLSIVIATPADAQGPKVVTDSCRDCTVALRRLHTITDVDGELHGATFSVGVGNWLVFLKRPSPLVYNSEGRFVGPIGRIGDGPGEIRNVVSIGHLAGDTVRVFMRGRSADFSLRKGFVEDKTLRSATPVNDLLLFPRGEHVVNIYPLSGTTGKDVNPFEVRNADGSRRSRPELLDTKGQAILKVVGRARESDHQRGIFWTLQSGVISPKGFLIQQVNLDGRVLQSLAVEPSWWQHVPPNARGERVAPSSRIVDIHQREDGLLLVTVVHPRENWRRLPRHGRGFEELSAARLIVIDPVRLEVRGIANLSAEIAVVASDSRIVTYEYDADRVLQFGVHEISIPARR
jgi:hypothetical protein